MIFGVFSDLHGGVGKWNAVNAWLTKSMCF